MQQAKYTFLYCIGYAHVFLFSMRCLCIMIYINVRIIRLLLLSSINRMGQYHSRF